MLFYMMDKNFKFSDEVYDEGSYLLVNNKGIEEKIDYKNIENISYNRHTNPESVTINLRTPY